VRILIFDERFRQAADHHRAAPGTAGFDKARLAHVNKATGIWVVWRVLIWRSQHGKNAFLIV
jgi:hypothetical protein